MSLNFPLNPVEGQEFVPAVGPKYIYSSTTKAWLLKTESIYVGFATTAEAIAGLEQAKSISPAVLNAWFANIGAGGGGGILTDAGAIITGFLNPSRLTASGVVAGTYNNANITVDSKGRVTLASNGERFSLEDSWMFN